MSSWPFNDENEISQMPLQWGVDSEWKTDPRWRVKINRARLGYKPDLPDLRDKSYVEVISNKLIKAGVKNKTSSRSVNKLPLPVRVNNIRYCTPIEDQGELGSCTAQAVVSLVEYMQRRINSDHIEGSRLFVYKVSRTLDGVSGDAGSYLRTALKAVSLFGVPPEKYLPYDINVFDEEPTAFLYSFAANYQALDYARLDTFGKKTDDLVADIKSALAAGLCVVFGFTVYSSISNSGDIPFPTDMDKVVGGHAVMAVGYDDGYDNGKGALIIRNSWGASWGYQGYGFLPYEYIRRGLANDFWVILKTEWLDLKRFE